MGIDIAIVGLAGRFPASDDVEQFWQNLVDGRDCITRFSPEELAAAGVAPEIRQHPDFVPAEPRIPGADTMDAALFRVSPREATQSDPQIRQFLECCHAALENAGYDPFAAPGPVGVFASAGSPQYLFEHLVPTRDPSNQTMVAGLNNSDYVATQVAYRLNLTGPAMTVLTACSSSLVGVHLATMALRAGECALALAGGSTIELDASYGYVHAPGGVRSADGRSRPFDAAGSGTVFGSGVGAVVLKRLDDAVVDGDHVYAVIQGSAINDDGAAKSSFGAPSVPGQVACIKAALDRAGVRPSELSYVEAHATGTAVGDPVELAALEQAWRSAEPGADLRCLIGSVKSNIGHPTQAAGVASLIKLALALDRETIPPSINVSELLPPLRADGCPLEVVRELRTWPREKDRPRYGAVSSFGVGGANSHLILQEPPLRTPTPLSGRPRVVVWSAKSDAAADALTTPLASHLATSPDYEDAVSTLADGRTPFSVRRAAVLAGPEDAATVTGPDAGSPVIRAAVPPGGAAPVFAFPGQGSLAPGALHELAADEPRFADHLDLAFGLFADRAGHFRDLWRTGRDATEITRTGNAQPILFALELALARTLEDWGLRPAAVTGHSLGELVAATVAGVFTPADAARAVMARADAMQRMPEGAMIAVFADPEAVAERLPGGLDLSALNGEAETVVGGPREEVAAFVRQLRDDGVRAVPLRTSHAFHSRSMQAARDEMLTIFSGLPRQLPRLPLISAATGRHVDEEVLDAAFWANQLIEPVRFMTAADALPALAMAGGARRRLVVIEAGPGQALTSLIRGRPSARESELAAVAITQRSRTGRSAGGRRDLLAAVATAWANGVSIDWPAVDQELPRRRVAVPGYRYQRKSYWVDAPHWSHALAARLDGRGGPDHEPAPGAPEATTGEALDDHPGDGMAPAAAPAFALPVWTEVPRPPTAPHPGATVVLMPADRAAARPVLIALHQISSRVLVVRDGSGYELRDRDAQLDVGNAEQLSRLLADLAARGQTPDRIVHATGIEPWAALDPGAAEEQLHRGFGSLLRLAQAMSRHAPGAELVVLTTRAVDVSGSDPLDPVKAAALGLVRSWPLEDASARVRLIDADRRVTEDDLADEFTAGTWEPVVALRGGHRWVPAELEMPVRPRSGPQLRRKGTYLITGGLGGLGLEVALGLARTGLQPSIALLSRRDATGDERVAAAVETAADLGAQIKVVTADIATERELRRALDIVTARLGPVSGIFHLAGVAGDGVVALRDLEAADAVLRPKVRGTLVLAEAFRDRPPLDFWVSFASRAGVTGLAGSADYAGANAFLDAYSVAAGDGDTRMLSIDWPSWSEVGMAAAGLSTEALRRAGARVFSVRLDPDRTWALDEHRLKGTPVLPGAAHIDLVVHAFRTVVDPAPGPLRLENVVFQDAIRVATPVSSQIVFLPDGEGWAFELRSGQPATVHSRGAIRRVDARPPGAKPVSSPGEASAVEPSRLAEEGRTFTLGPRWDCIVRESSADDQTTVELRLDERFRSDLAEHPVHPALLDCATASARPAGRGTMVPFAYGSLVLYADLPGHLISSIRRSRDTKDTIVADIDMMAPDGTPIAIIEKFTMRTADPAALAGRPDATASAPAESSPSPIAPGDAAPELGIPPGRGVELLMELLDARTARQVLVRPFAGGQPEPLPPSGRPGVAAPASSAFGASATVPAVVAPAGAVSSAARSGAKPELDAEPSATPGPQPPVDRMRAVWTAVLGPMELGPDDDFFDIGGTSLSAIELVARIRDEFGATISIAQLLDTPTLGDMAAAATS
jgi:phthiocerol/phenolphthiocerol synthesis type-I polyketide synthase E